MQGKKSVRETQKHSNRTRIQNLCRDAFFEKGYTRLCMDEIAVITGFTKRTIYKYFESKEELYEKISQASLEEFEEELKKENFVSINAFLQFLYTYSINKKSYFYFIKAKAFEIKNPSDMKLFQKSLSPLINLIENRYEIKSVQFEMPLAIWGLAAKGAESGIPINKIEELILHGLA